MTRLVIAAVDQSDHTIPVLTAAQEQAVMRGGELRVVSVFNSSWVAVADPSGLSGAGSAAMFEAQQLTQEAVRKTVLEQLGEEVQFVELTGYPAGVICRYAKEEDAELIVVGNRGAGELKSLLLGSTSHGVIHDAHCDVMIVKRAHEESD